MDEPHTGLDQDACDMLDGVLREVAGSGRTVVMTSHDLARAADLASRFDVLSRGMIAASPSAPTCAGSTCWHFTGRSLRD